MRVLDTSTDAFEGVLLIAEALRDCVQEVCSLLVTVVDTKGSVGRGLLKALEGLVACLSSMPDLQQVARYTAAGLHRPHGSLTSVARLSDAAQPFFVDCTRARHSKMYASLL